MPLRIIISLVLSIINWVISAPLIKYLVKFVAKIEISWGQTAIIATVIQAINFVAILLFTAMI